MATKKQTDKSASAVKVARKWKQAPAELVHLFESEMTRLGVAEVKKMFGYPAGFVNDNMFAAVFEERVIFRLRIPYRLLVYLVSAWVLGLALCGCATRSAVPRAAQTLGHPPVETSDNGFWWACRFKVAWPPDAEPDFAVDLLLAHAVVRPVLSQYEEKILYWRFHRRAARDQAGHRFSFLFYTDPGTAAEIFRKIEESKPLEDALAARIVEETGADDPGKPTKPNVADSSDPHWSPTLQRNWPAFIMGVSALWLGLIDEAMAENPGKTGEIRALLERYRTADTRITAVWNKEGQHALLHHLNALFGYKPLLIRKELTF